MPSMQVLPGKFELHRLESVANQDKTKNSSNSNANTASKLARSTTEGGMAAKEAAGGVGRAFDAHHDYHESFSGQAPAVTARRRTALVEPDSTEEQARHFSPVVTALTVHVETEDERETNSGVHATGGGVSVGINLGGGGAAIPASPPSSPAYVTTAPERVAVGPKAAAEAEAKTKGCEVSSPSGGGGPAPTALIDLPATPLLPAALLTGAATMKKAEEGEKNSATGAGAGAIVVHQLQPPRPPPVRLGRGRKLCPNCNALTKSAVKQCRECHHFFSPASSRLRPPPRVEPKENENVAMPTRRRVRPSQRLVEYECESMGPSGGGAGGGGAGAAQEAGRLVGGGVTGTTRRPLATSPPSNGGGGTNHIATSGGGGGRPAASDGGRMAKKSASTTGGGSGTGGAVSAPVATTPTPKRSHKRKVCP